MGVPGSTHTSILAGATAAALAVGAILGSTGLVGRELGVGPWPSLTTAGGVSLVVPEAPSAGSAGLPSGARSAVARVSARGGAVTGPRALGPSDPTAAVVAAARALPGCPAARPLSSGPPRARRSRRAPPAAGPPRRPVPAARARSP
jgi:hypothetical protein